MSEARLNRLQRLFESALRLGDTERRAFLDRECVGDRALREQVESLLAIDAGALRDPHHPFSDEGNDCEGAEWLAAGLAADDTAVREPAPARIGRFQIVREIGRGGMGIVYEAQQDAPARRVALKVIHPGLISRGLLRRFRQETRAMAQLRHPGIAQIYEAGVSVEGVASSRPYFVMELVDGPAIDDFAAAHGLDHRARLELVARVCDALHHAHQKGVVHRDLKPDNILVHAPPADHTTPAHRTSTLADLSADIQPKVLDFGVARLAEEPETGSLRTQHGQIVGTMPYLSPEQALGESAVADIRSDIYSVGVIAYELLSGQLPFDTADRPLRAAVRTIADTPAPRLSQRVRNLDPDIETIVHTAMQRQPELRYQSAADLAGDIRRYLASQPIIARAPSRLYLTRKFVQRNLALTSVAVSSAFLLVVALVMISSLWVNSLRAEHEAVWQRYRSAMSAAGFALQSGEIGIARKHLESTDPRHRGWEYRHFLARVDQSQSAFTPTIRAASSSLPPRSSVPFIALPDVASSGTLILIPADRSATYSLALDSDASPVALDPRLALYYAARAGGEGGLSVPFSLQSDQLFFPPAPGAGSSEPVARRFSPWPFEPGEQILSPRLSKDGRVFIALRRHTADIVIADLTTGRTRTITLPKGVSGMRTAISADGSRIAVSNGYLSTLPLQITLFDTGTGEEVVAITDLPSEVSSLLLDSHGTRVFAAFHDGSVGAWDASIPRATRRFFNRLGLDRVENLTLSPDQTLLAAGTLDGVVHVFDAATLESLLALVGHEYGVYDCRFLPRLAQTSTTASVNNAGNDVADAKSQGGQRGKQDRGVRWGGSDGLISTGVDGSVRRWSLNVAMPGPRVIQSHTHLVHAMALSDNNRCLVTGSWDRSVAFFDIDSGRELGRVPTTSYVQQLVLSPDERWVAAREFGGVVRVIDAHRRVEVALLTLEASRIDQPVFDPTSQRVLFDFDPEKRITMWWDIASRSWVELPSASLLSADARDRPARAPILNPRLGMIAMSQKRDARDVATIYDIRSGNEVLTIPTRRPATEAVAFTPDGRAVAAADDDHRIQLYELPSGRRIGTFTGHLREVLALVFSPDGSRLFSADYTGAIWVWDVPTRESITQLRGHPDHVRRLVISDDGHTLYSGGRDGTVRVWDAPPTANSSRGHSSTAAKP